SRRRRDADARARVPPDGGGAGGRGRAGLGCAGPEATRRGVRTARGARELSAHALGGRARCGPSVRREVPDVMSSRLIGVGVGPGDPELVTVKGVHALRAADVVVVPVMDTGERGRAEATVLHYVPVEKVVR